MGSKLKRINQSKFHSQRGRCFYCQQPMWIDSPTEFCRNHGMTMRHAAKFQSTAEHLVARCDGGKDNPSNIVAACMYCNRTRHRTKEPQQSATYLEKVRARLSMGRWHGFVARQLF
ncbi:HNH endonuclease [Roseovarius confluentis]|uniref:HNH endonuclease n=1 Tax=Roseovarius confluentis TaxID=1852027 RepID=UPI003BA99A7F